MLEQTIPLGVRGDGRGPIHTAMARGWATSRHRRRAVQPGDTIDSNLAVQLPRKPFRTLRLEPE